MVGRGRIYIHNRFGKRKSSASYFTKAFAVEHLLDRALGPAVTAHLDRLDGLVAVQAQILAKAWPHDLHSQREVLIVEAGGHGG